MTLFARLTNRSTMRAIPPLRVMMPTMPPIIIENRMIDALSGFASAPTTNTWKLSSSPAKMPVRRKRPEGRRAQPDADQERRYDVAQRQRHQDGDDRRHDRNPARQDAEFTARERIAGGCQPQRGNAGAVDAYPGEARKTFLVTGRAQFAAVHVERDGRRGRDAPGHDIERHLAERDRRHVER
ncbi:MAG: hypothetical protein U5K76_02340 [Woeseiaceae bacterium]|nr:hypothetical protein [Woeseiaceae bacterium]